MDRWTDTGTQRGGQIDGQRNTEGWTDGRIGRGKQRNRWTDRGTQRGGQMDGQRNTEGWTDGRIGRGGGGDKEQETETE